VKSGGPNSSLDIEPWACASAGARNTQASTTKLRGPRHPTIADSRVLINCNCILLAMIISEGFQVPSNGPNCQITSNELTDPVADKSRSAAERERNVLSFSQETA
jgi:hypothetical protein